jgi:hypothetical protein
MEPCYTADELSALLGASTRTIRRRVSAGLWPHMRAGSNGRLLFTREHVRLIVAAFNEAHDYPAHEPGREVAQ